MSKNIALYCIDTRWSGTRTRWQKAPPCAYRKRCANCFASCTLCLDISQNQPAGMCASFRAVTRFPVRLCCVVSAEWQRSALCPARPRMNNVDALEETAGDRPSFRLQPLKTTHLPGKTSPSRSAGGSDTRPCYSDAVKVTANGVHDIEDRILRITGYYGYYPGYSSHRSKYSVLLRKKKTFYWINNVLE